VRVRHKSGNEEIVRVERKMEGERCERGVAQFASCKACEIMSDSDHDKRAEHLTTRDMKATAMISPPGHPAHHVNGMSVELNSTMDGPGGPKLSDPPPFSTQPAQTLGQTRSCTRNRVACQTSAA
jgi:hypothetical protein